MRYLLLLTTTMLTISLSAQRGGERGKRGEKIEQQRIAFFTTELDLSIEEAQTFWPLYNDYQNAKKEIDPDRKTQKKIEDMTEEESRLVLSQAMDSKRKQIDLEIEFMNKLERVLPSKKRLKLIRLEREFKKTVLKRYQKRLKRSEKQLEKQGKKEKRMKERKEEKERN